VFGGSADREDRSIRTEKTHESRGKGGAAGNVVRTLARLSDDIETKGRSTPTVRRRSPARERMVGGGGRRMEKKLVVSCRTGHPADYKTGGKLVRSSA